MDLPGHMGHTSEPETLQMIESTVPEAPEIASGYAYGVAEYTQAMPKCMIVPESGVQAPELSVFTSRSLLGQICNPVNTNLPEQRLMRRNAPNLQPQARIITQATPIVTGKRLNSFDLQIPADQSSLLMSVLKVTKTDLAAIKNDLVATMKDMIKSSLLEIGVVPKPPISNDVDPPKKTS